MCVCGCHIPIMSTSHPSSSSEHDPVLQPNVSSNFPSVPRGSWFPCPLSRDRECQAQGFQQSPFCLPWCCISDCRRWVEQVIHLLQVIHSSVFPRNNTHLGWRKTHFSTAAIGFPALCMKGCKRAAVPCVLVLFSSLLTLAEEGRGAHALTGGRCPPGGPVKCKWK